MEKVKNTSLEKVKSKINKTNSKIANSKIIDEKKDLEKFKKVLNIAKSSIEDNKTKIKVLFVTSEALPFCATGGLADVCGSLPKFIRNSYKDIDIRVILPLYSSIPDEYRNKFEKVGETNVTLAWRKIYCGIFKYNIGNLTYYFIDNEYYFKRDHQQYGFNDDCERFAFFSKAVIEILPIIDFIPNIIHCNDWQTGLIPVYIKTNYIFDNRYNNIKCIFNIHNLQYQGRFSVDYIKDIIGIEKQYSKILEYDKDLNIMKGAIVCSDKVITVSPTYAQEIKTNDNYLAPIISQYSYKIMGILNGLDGEFYNPKTDKFIYNNYDFESLETRRHNKEELQKVFGLEVDANIPMIGIVTRMPKHKGMDLIKQAMEEIVQSNVQFVGVGEGDKEYEDYFKYLNYKYPSKVHVSLGFSIEWGRKIYSAIDILLMPSLTEPCGLSQMIASRFGAVPLVRETGGLKDTIKDFGCKDGGNGYTFANFDANDFKYSIRRALEDYKNKEEWKKKIKIVMDKDFGWDKTAQNYIVIYEELI